MSVQWRHVRYFRREEFDDPHHPGSGDLADGRLVMVLDELRHRTGWPVSILAAVDVAGRHGHSSNSYHLARCGAMAADFVFKTKASVRAQIRTVMAAACGGTGVYYDWGVAVGFHVDVRPVQQYQVWTRREGRYLYLVEGP